MSTPDNIQASSLYTGPRYWLLDVGTAAVAGLIAAGVSFLGRRLHWPQPQLVALAVFFFLVFSIHPHHPGRPEQGWVSRVLAGLVAAAVGSSIYAMLSNW